MTQQVWVLICGALVFFMQAGFTCYEAGFVQSKNVISVSIENLLTFMITALVFTFAGFYLMFGRSVFNMTTDMYGYLFLQVTFAAVAVTIFAGAMSERSKLPALLIASVVAAGLIYPMFGRWVWGMGPGSVLGAGFSGELGTGFGPSGAWLAGLGYMDFAGATVVHSTAGFITLAGLIVVGSRKDMKGGRSNIPLATLGVFILWFGWLGFNGGNADLSQDTVGLVFMNTTLAASAGMMGALSTNLIVRRKGQYLISIFNGVLSGLVAITAMSGYCGIWQSCVVGFIAGIAADLSSTLLERLGIDDVVNAIPTHLVGGVCGALLLPLLIQSQYLACSSRLAQLGVQALGVGVDLVWTLGTSLLLFLIIDRTMGLRVGADEERKGLNIVDFNDIYSWENYLEKSAYESRISEQNRLLRKQTRLLTMTEEQERDKLARELHDGLGQSLAALKLILRMADAREEAGDGAVGDGRRSVTTEALSLTETSIAEMRNVIGDLRPTCLDAGLDSAIGSMVEGIDRIDGFDCRLEVTGDMPDFDEVSSLNIYRLIQEALTNVVKHSQASEVCVTCWVENGLFHVRVADDGVGFDPGVAEKGVGISSMSDRAKMMGGNMRIVSHPGSGTTMDIEVPVNYE